MSASGPKKYQLFSIEGYWEPNPNGTQSAKYVDESHKVFLNLGDVASIRQIVEKDIILPLRWEDTLHAIHPDARTVITTYDGIKVYIADDIETALQARRSRRGSDVELSQGAQLISDFDKAYPGRIVYTRRPETIRVDPTQSRDEEPVAPPSASFWYYAKQLATPENLKIAYGAAAALLCFTVADVATSKLAADKPTSADFTAQIVGNNQPGPYDCLTAFGDQGFIGNVVRLWTELHKFITGNPAGIMTPAQFETCRVEVVYNVIKNKQNGYASAADDAAKDAQKLVDTKAVGDYVAWGQKSQWVPVTIWRGLGL